MLLIFQTPFAMPDLLLPTSAHWFLEVSAFAHVKDNLVVHSYRVGLCSEKTWPSWMVVISATGEVKQHHLGDEAVSPETRTPGPVLW